MRILICDDNFAIRLQLEKYIIEYFKRNALPTPEIKTFSSGVALLEDDGNKDIVFLDIEMPEINGIVTGAQLKTNNPNVLIFMVTSYAKYLDEAMHINVFRYLSKPLEKERLYRNLKEALQIYHSHNIKIVIETKNGVHTFLSDEIICIEAIARKILVHTIHGQFESIHNMNYWISHVPDNSFFQTHRSYIVNMKHISNFDHSVIYLCDKKCAAYLTRRKYSAFKNHYLRYIENTK